jgi:hypothetical protein
LKERNSLQLQEVARFPQLKRALNHKIFSSFAVQLSQNPSIAKESLEVLPSHFPENKTGKVFENL